MQYLHNSNPLILHRDLKSPNLLVEEDWTIKVADFGLTRFMGERKMSQVGTPIWMAPEIIRNNPYTQKADVYAFGIILWEILHRKEPYENMSPIQIVVAVVNENNRPQISEEYVSHPFVPLMKTCWDEEPKKRPDFHEIIESLNNMLEQQHQRETSRYDSPLSTVSVLSHSGQDQDEDEEDDEEEN